MPGRTERRDRRGGPRDVAGAAEELDVLGVGARPAALDERDAERVELLRDAELVAALERDPLALRAVAQRGVVDRDRRGDRRVDHGSGAVSAAAHTR
jgi:hypothetical protein